MNTWATAWGETEKALTDWLAAKLGHDVGNQAFYAEDYPRALPNGDDWSAYWCLFLSGGEVDPNRQSRNEIKGGCWHMGGQITIRGRSAGAVRALAAEIFGWLPVGSDDVANVARLYPTAYPTFSRVLLPIASSALENEVCFESDIAVRCAFVNTQTEE